MAHFRRIVFLLCVLGIANAQPKSETDVIVFQNGDRLSGHLVLATNSKIVFKNEALGELTIEWSKIKELHTSGPVAVIRQGVKLSRHENVSSVPKGTLNADSQTLQLTPAQSIPVKEAVAVVPEPDFTNAITHRAGFFQDWKGGITLGATVIQATQNNRTFNGAIALSRVEPSESWMNPRNRTDFNVSSSYGELSQPDTPTVKTSIFHADLQRDEYLTPSFFVLGAAAYDHNFSQGLDLQQTYNGGVGWTPINTAVDILNLKASMSYVRQQFTKGPDQNLIGSVFSEDYMRHLSHGTTLAQKATFAPAWNNTNAYSAAFSALFTMPIYKKLSASTGILDTYLNNPPAGFKKNSFQFTLGLTYTID